MGMIWLAGGDWASHYDARQLDLADKIRSHRHPRLHNRTDWQVSRALKHTAGAAVRSLSHSRGATALLAGIASNTAAGVDIEHCRPRDFERLTASFMTPEEYFWWQSCADKPTGFYMLWTIKEALIKAADLNFPVNLQDTGLTRHHGKWSFKAGGGVSDWFGQTALIGGAYVVSCVWQQPASAPDWKILGGLAAHPLVYLDFG